MTEAQAWRTVARRLAALRVDFIDAYLCHQIEDMEEEGRIDVAMADAMRDRVRAHLKLKANVNWFYPSPSAYANDEGNATNLCGARILAALWLALESAEDESSTPNESPSRGVIPTP